MFSDRCSLGKPALPIFTLKGSACDLKERGITLLEAALFLAMLGTALGILNLLVQEEFERRRWTAMGQDLRFMTQSVQRFVDVSYDSIRDDLVTAGANPLIASISMDVVAMAGLIPASVIDGTIHANPFNQNYHLLVRGVMRRDTANPQATVISSVADADADGNIDDHLVDGNPANGELDIEAILITVGGRAVEPQHGNLAVAEAALFSTGYQHENDLAQGSFGVWRMDTSPYRNLTHAPQDKHFVSLIALSGYGVLGHPAQHTEPSMAAGTGLFLERCPSAADEIQAKCEADNKMYTDVAFVNHDSDDDGTLDYLSVVSGLNRLAMAAPVDSDGDGTPDSLSAISGVTEIACGSDLTGNQVLGTLLVTCADVRLSNDLAIGGSLDVDGSVSVEGSTVIDDTLQATLAVTAERFRATAINGQDLTKGVFFADLVAMEPVPTITKPICKDAGSDPRIYVTPSSFLSPDGVPTIGVRAYATSGSGSWTVHMEAAIDVDHNSDGMADIIALSSDKDYALVLTRCS